MRDIHVNRRILAAFVGFCHIILFTTAESRIGLAQQQSPLANSMGILSERDIVGYKFALINGLGPLSVAST